MTTADLGTPASDTADVPPPTTFIYQPTEGRRRYVPMVAVAIAAFGAFLAFMDSTVVNVAFPNIQASFPHVRFGTLSWVLNAYNVVFAGPLVLFGRIADLVGRRRVFRMGLVTFVVMSGLSAASTSVQMLIVFRVLQGAGAAMLVPASLAIVVHASPPGRRAHALSLSAAAGALAAGLGPPIGGALVSASNWRLVFLINLPLGILAWVLARRTVLESRAPGRRVMPDLRGAIALSAALGAVTLAIVQGSSWGWAGAGTLAAFAVAAVATPIGRVADRAGPRAVVVPGALVRAGAFLWYATRVGHHPDSLGQWLPGQVLSGIGVGATLPAATSGGLSAVPAGRYATASAVNSSVRQIGGTFGIAVLTILVSHPSAATLPDELRRGWEPAGWSFLAAAAVAPLFGPGKGTPGSEDEVGHAPALADADPVVATAAEPQPENLLSDLPEGVRERVLAASVTLQYPPARRSSTPAPARDPTSLLGVIPRSWSEITAGSRRIHSRNVKTLQVVERVAPAPS